MFSKSVIALSVVSALFSITGSVAVAQESAALAQETAANNEQDVEVIQVRGLRGSVIKSIAEKRFADGVQDSITATDIGKLPDTTIADSLQRITGVQINRSGGEGSSVNIRGINQVGTTLNGEQMLTASGITTVQPNFTDIPSTMISGVDVMKSTQAKVLSQGMSGVINLKTYRPFDLDDGFTVNAKAEVTDGSMGPEQDETVSAFIGYNQDDKFGFSLNISKSNKNLADYMNGSAGFDWGFIANESASFAGGNPVDASYDGDTDDVFYSFQGHLASNQFVERDRTGVNGSAQWQITDGLQLKGDFFYTKMDQLNKQAGFIASQAWQSTVGWYTPDMQGGLTAHENLQRIDDVPTEMAGNFYSFNSGVLQARRTMVHSEANAYEAEALNTNLELSYEADDFSVTARWVHGEAKNDNALSVVDAYANSGSQVGATFKGAGGVPVSDVNPWGYDGQSAILPDGSVVDSVSMIPIGIGYDASGDQTWNLPLVNNIDGEEVLEVFGSNINRYSATSTNLTGANREADMDVVRIDGNYFLEYADLESVDFGVRVAKRDVMQQSWIGGVARTNQYGDAYLSRWKDSASQAPDTGESFIEPISFAELDRLGMITQVSDFQGATGLGSLYMVDPEAMADPLAWHNQVYGQNIQSPNGANSYDLQETITSAFLQANLNGELFDMSYKANVGVRYMQTELDINQSELGTSGSATYNGVNYLLKGSLGMLPPAASKINTVRDYNDVLPAVNFALNLTDDQVLRFAYNKTVTSHNTNQLGGGINITRILACNLQEPDGTSVFCATQANQQGNPYLEPWRSTNLDLSYEWYFSETGMFSVAAFMIDIETFIANTTIRLPLADSDGQVRGYNPATGEFEGTTPTSTPGNGEGGTVEGIEVSYQQELGELIEGLDGYGITTNYTYSPSTSGDMDYYGAETPMYDNSEHQANFALWYDKDGLQARIAANYRSETFQGVRNVDPYYFASYLKPTTYVDASVSYDFGDNFTVLLQGTNLTEESRTRYFQWEDMVDKKYYNERRVTLGIQYRM